MAVAAFKSTSRRASTTSTATQDKETSTNQHALPTKTVPPRRSRSVSAVSRSYLVDTSTTRTAAEGTATGSTNLLIKRDNPLYWSNVSPPDKEVGEVVVDKEESKSAPTKPNVVGDGRRGRSVSRKADAGKNVSGIGRSLSRGPVSRGRSVSRPPGSRGHFVNSESDAEREGSSLTKYRNGSGGLSGVSNAGRNSDLARSYDCKFEKMRSFPMQSDGSASDLPSLPMRSWEDKGLGSSISEAEERTIKAVFEQMQSFQGDNLGDGTSSRIYETVRSEVRRAIADIQNDLESTIRRSNTTAIALANVNDIPPDLVNPSAVELVLDIRREYAKKLEQSQERARKLRADLAVEEHRGLELSRILKEVLPHPKMSNVQKPRAGRKSSIERSKVSKRLTDEAMAYFDECVSLSTFDSSDFSSPEDPPINLVGVGDCASFSQENSNTAANCYPNSFATSKQELVGTHSHGASVLSTTGSSQEPALEEVTLNSSETPDSRRLQFSFAQKPNDSIELQQDIRKYVKSFEKDTEKTAINSKILRSNHFDLDEYNLQASRQNFLFDTVFLNNRIQSGSVLLCDGGMGVSFSPFAAVI
ncbi:hypothetical protein D5086_015520 [Populus alba]|uniref:Uncharacterized protein n=3 Tax=Populus TaxID=3689 RepID=A0A4U5MBH2_POPAL|nr:uncharacterized protein LOC118045049 [Populus alba]KAJ6989129.1 hypothetical protein NC653_021879 [Populus alba x Populus x berolinensis]TKR66450.1 hypothetical protein D5086_0000311400 [Populus alba]